MEKVPLQGAGGPKKISRLFSGPFPYLIPPSPREIPIFTAAKEYGLNPTRTAAPWYSPGFWLTHKGDAGPKVKKILLKNVLQKALYPTCRSKKSPKSPPKSRNNFFEFFLEQEK